MAWNDDRVDPGLPSRLVTFVLATLGEAIVLRVLGVGASATLGWALLSAVVVAVLERELLSALAAGDLFRREEKTELKIDIAEKISGEGDLSADVSSLAGETEPSPDVNADAKSDGKDARVKPQIGHCLRLTIELAAPAVLGLTFVIGSGRLTLAEQGRPGVERGVPCVVQQSGDNSAGGGFQGERGGCGGEGTLRLSPALEKALERYLNQDREGDGGGGWNTLLLLAIAAGVVFLAFAVSKHPSTAAPLSAAGIALAAMKSEHLSHMDRWGSFAFLVAFLAVCAVLVCAAFKRPPGWWPRDTEGDGERKGKVVESPMNMVLSLAILLWTGLLLCYYQPQQPTPQPQPPVTQPPPPLSGKVEYRLLPPIPGFAPFSATLPASGDPVGELAKALGSPQSGRLLLLGSADCTAIRAKNGMTNARLAERRAAAVKMELEKKGAGGALAIDAVSLHQHDRCRESSDLRAVFPVLMLPQGQ